MNALTQLTAYNSSGSDDDDDDDNGNDNFCDKKEFERLPLPSLFNSSSKNEIMQEINEDGKIRNFPHERGIWATFVHISILSNPELVEFVSDLKCFFEPLTLHFVKDFHISLTKTVILKHHWIQGFTEIVKKHLIDICCFKIHLQGLKVCVNEEKTRTFVSLMVDEGLEYLKHVVNLLNSCLSEYNLPTFYENPMFHVSLLWCSGDKFNELNSVIKTLPSKIKSFNFFSDVNECCCTSGNKNFKFNFR